MLNLENVDIVSFDCNHPQRTIDAMNICMSNINFGNAYLFTDSDESDFENTEKIKFIKIQKVSTRDKYNDFFLGLKNYCDNDYVLIIQWHGFIINPELWDPEFLKYDYIGAPWTTEQARSWGLINRVGNGGFCLRSRKFLEYSSQFQTCQGCNEDGYLTHFRLKDAILYGINFPNVDIAYKFSCECLESGQNFDPSYHFGFHGDDKMPAVRDYLESKNVDMLK